MSYELEDLFANNRAWAKAMEDARPGFFTKLTAQQKPQYMWIGCSDSRVPANEIMGLAPGEVFVHRNIANVVVHSDLNALSTVQFAVDLLKVQHVMVVGHYGCAGVRAALDGTRVGLADNWLRHIRDVADRHREVLDLLPEHGRAAALCELNVIEQVVNVAHSTVLQDAWARGQDVTLHGWVYDLQDGLLQDLHITVRSMAEVQAMYREAVSGVRLVPRLR
jgi:carbonic anhydrase